MSEIMYEFYTIDAYASGGKWKVAFNGKEYPHDYLSTIMQILGEHGWELKVSVPFISTEVGSMTDGYGTCSDTYTDSYKLMLQRVLKNKKRDTSDLQERRIYRELQRDIEHSTAVPEKLQQDEQLFKDMLEALKAKGWSVEEAQSTLVDYSLFTSTTFTKKKGMFGGNQVEENASIRVDATLEFKEDFYSSVTLTAFRKMEHEQQFHTTDSQKIKLGKEDTDTLIDQFIDRALQQR